MAERWFQRAECLILVVGVLAAASGVRSVIVGDTVTSRLATVWSLTHDRTWYVDRPAEQTPNPFEQRTVDKVAVGNHLISSKPPVLTLLMTAEYIALHRFFGWDMEEAVGLKRQLQCMILSLVVLAYAGTLFFFLKTLRLFEVAPGVRLYSLAALAFGTQLFGFAPHLNNHLPGTCMAMAAVYLALGLGSGRLHPAPWRFVCFGLCAGLVGTGNGALRHALDGTRLDANDHGPVHADAKQQERRRAVAGQRTLRKPASRICVKQSKNSNSRWPLCARS